jgi:predicted small lipoprotein YifL
MRLVPDHIGEAVGRATVSVAVVSVSPTATPASGPAGSPLHCITVLVLAVALAACGRKAGYDAPEYKAAADAAKSGFVAPLQDDSAADIMSWVDGAPVTDWNAEIQKRERDI